MFRENYDELDLPYRPEGMGLKVTRCFKVGDRTHGGVVEMVTKRQFFVRLPDGRMDAFMWHDHASGYVDYGRLYPEGEIVRWDDQVNVVGEEPKSKNRKYIWMAVTDDEFENVEHIADTARELAEVMGVKVGKIRSMIRHKSVHNGCRVMRMIDDELQ